MNHMMPDSFTVCFVVLFLLLFCFTHISTSLKLALYYWQYKCCKVKMAFVLIHYFLRFNVIPCDFALDIRQTLSCNVQLDVLVGCCKHRANDANSLRCSSQILL